MTKRMIHAAAALVAMAGPALAGEEGPFFSLQNPLFNVTLGFVLFLALMFFLKVPRLVGEMLRKRAETIRAEIEEARALREEAQKLLASYERKQHEVKEKAQRIIEHAREEAETAARVAREELQKSIERRMAAAQEQIESARAQAVKEVRDTAAQVAVGAAGDVVRKSMSAAQANKLIDSSIREAEEKLH